MAEIEHRSAGQTGWDRPRLTALFLLAAIFLFGVAEIMVLPPWEGFDEIAHWSSIQEVADLHRVPVYGEARLSADRLGYFGPEPRGVDLRHRSYRTFHDTPSPRPLKADGPNTFLASPITNWQAQHPPLFYGLMTPLYRAVHGLGWVDHLLVLRLACWLMATVGLALGTWAIQRATERSARSDGDGFALRRWTAPLSLMWPLLFAGFFADLARLGNDSLCLLLFGGIWRLLLPLLDGDERSTWKTWASLVALGLLMGAGLWTKAFFGPISLGVAALLAARAIKARSVKLGLQTAIPIAIAWIIGAGWYLMKWRTTGSLTGSDETVQLIKAGGLWHGLAAHFSLEEMLKGFASISETVGWVGTWSLTRVSEQGMMVVALLLAAVSLSYLARLPHAPLVAWAPLAVMAPIMAGLVYHVFLRLAIDGRGSGTPAWYVHVIAPALCLMLALGWTRPRLFLALGTFSVIYTAASWSAQLSLFSGCTAPDALNHYDFAHRICGIDGGTLDRLGHPGLGAVALLLALGCAAAAAIASRPAWRGFGAVATPNALEPL